MVKTAAGFEEEPVLRKPVDGATLVVIDVQRAIDDPSWGERNNRGAEANIACLLAHWRKNWWPIVHVKHNSLEPRSTYRVGQPGNDFKPEAMPQGVEAVIVKHTPDAFVGTKLETHLRAGLGPYVVICGVITNNSVESTARHAGCLGFKVSVVEDACFTFRKTDWNGVARTAEEVHAMSLANLAEEYASIVKTGDLVG